MYTILGEEKNDSSTTTSPFALSPYLTISFLGFNGWQRAQKTLEANSSIIVATDPKKAHPDLENLMRNNILSATAVEIEE